jgi:glycosyltransferase involved in cell wall biosynthesis
MSEITLSFVLTTYNKLTYLKITLGKAIENRKEDEEIIVVDGGSKDGTPEYLQQLFNARKIQKFVSEKDFGEGHGFNKGMLMAEGRLIKLLTDDDAYDFRVINACKKYMLENPHIDYLNTHGGWYDIQAHNEIHVFTEVYLILMQEWKDKGTPFACCMLGAMLNKRSLPFLGLINPSIKRADAEYSLRMTSQKIKMVWYLGISYVRVLNQQSNSVVFNELIRQETQKLNSFYNVFMDYYKEEVEKPSLKQQIKRPLRKAYTLLFGERKAKEPIKEKAKEIPKVNEGEAFEYVFQWMDKANKELSTTFITNV